MNCCRFSLHAACAALVLGAGAAHANEAPDVMWLAQAPARWPVGGDETIAFAAHELGHARVVKGAPYCADALQESVQPLADGNRIVRRHATRLCRDGEGRTRQEVERGGRRLVYLHDPVAAESWMLDPQLKTAWRLPGAAGAAVSMADTPAWREYLDKVREWGRGFGERAARDGLGAAAAGVSNAPPPVPPATIMLPPHEAHPHVAHEAHVLVLRADGPDPALPPTGLMPFNVPLPPPVALRAQLGAPRGPGVATSLGGKTIDGLKVHGERTTWTIEAGKLGNEKPIVITRDVWSSPDLILTVESRDADPRFGETSYRLANLKRGEPDATLMKVPPDYAAARPGAAPKPPGAASAKG